MRVRGGTFASGVFFVTALCVADTYPRQPAIDAQHYTFRITLSDDTDEISGEATADLRFTRDGVTEIALDLAKPMTVSEVLSDGAALRFRHDADRLMISLATAPKSGQRRQFTVKYHGTAAGGLWIGKNRYGERVFFSRNWPDLAHQWLPVIDHPYDKATSEFLVT